jgi:hypothetical protein
LWSRWFISIEVLRERNLGDDLHGSFFPWIGAEFGMNERASQRFMNVAKVYASKSANLADLSAEALYELAAPKTPVEVREEVDRLLAAGEIVTKAAVEAIISSIRA